MRAQPLRSARVFAALVAFALLARERGSDACAWDDETIPAESGSLACVYDAVLGTFPKHTKEYYEARLRAADAMLAWHRFHVPALDMKGVAALKLKRFDVAEQAMKLRLEVLPDDYASHANLGTLYTFTGDFAKALAFTEAALGKEPKAHFGREGYHKALIEYLRDLKADPKIAEENFLRVSVSAEERSRGTPQVFASRGVKEDVFDALVAMITVYGADDVPFVYHALGDMLALRGQARLAWVAYQRAIELDHPAKKAVAAQQARVRDRARGEHIQRHNAAHKGSPPKEGAPGALSPEGVSAPYYLLSSPQSGPKLAVKKYQEWERAQIAKGLAVWTEAGLNATYAKGHELVPRCVSPHIVDARAWESPK